MMYKVAQ